jgi:hypothetical protein
MGKSLKIETDVIKTYCWKQTIEETLFANRKTKEKNAPKAINRKPL